MVRKLETEMVYQLDPDDHKKVILYWKNIGEFTKYMSRVDSLHDVYYCYARDFHKAHGAVIDGRTPGMTRDQRFCNSRMYMGDVHYYHPNGLYAGTMTMKEFRDRGCWQWHVGVFAAPYGYAEFRGLDIMMRQLSCGYFWDYAKYEAINTITIKSEYIPIIGEEMYLKLSHGEVPHHNPESKYKMRKEMIKTHKAGFVEEVEEEL